MFGKWFEQYQKLSQRTRFISQLGAFLIALSALLSLFDIVYFLHFINYLSVKGFFKVNGLPTAVIFQTIVLTVFALRFVLLFFKSEKTFKISQFLWLFGFIILVIYWYISRPEPPEPGAFGFYSTFPEPIFSHAARIFDGFGVFYLILSPVKNVITLLFTLIKSK